MPGVPRTPASEPSATNAHHHHHVGRRPDDNYMSSATFLARVHPRTLAFLARSFTPYAVDSGYSFPASRCSPTQRRQQHRSYTPAAALQLFSVGSGIWMGAGTSNSGGTCVEVVSSRDCVPGSGSEERDGCCSVVFQTRRLCRISFLPS